MTDLVTELSRKAPWEAIAGFAELAAEHGRLVSFEKDEVVAAKGSVVAELLIPITAPLRVTGGGEVRRIRKHEAIDLAAVLSGGVYDYTATAESTTFVLAIPRAAFRAGLADMQNVADYLNLTAASQTMRSFQEALIGRRIARADIVRIIGRVTTTPVVVKAREHVPKRASVWFVESGEVRITRREEKSVKLGHGAYFGGETLISPFQPTAEAIAVDDLVLYELPSADARTILNEFDLVEMLNDGNAVAQLDARSVLPSSATQLADVPGRELPIDQVWGQQELRVDLDRLLRTTSQRESNLMSVVNALLFIGVPANVSTLRAALATVRLSFLTVAETIEPYGVATRATAVTIATIARHRLPGLLAMGGRLVVLIAVDDRKKLAVVHDPIHGFLELTFAELAEEWDGMLLELVSTEPDPETERSEKAPIPFRERPTVQTLLSTLAENRQLLANLGLLAGLTIALGLVQPFLSQLVLDEVLTLKDTGVLVTCSVGILVSSVLFAGVRWLQQVLFAELVNAFDGRVGVQFYRRALGLPLGFFAQYKAGDVLTRLGDLEDIREFLATQSLQVIVDVFSVIVTTIVLAFYSGTIALLALGVGVLLIIIELAVGGSLHRNYAASAREATRATSLIAEQVGAVSTVKAFGAARVLRERWERVYLKGRRLALKSALLNSGSGAVLQVVGTTARVGGLWLAARATFHGQLTAGEVLAVSLYLNRIVDSVSQIGSFFGNALRVRTSFDNVSRIMDAEQEIPKGRALTTLNAALEGKIKVEGLRFRYSDESDWVLRDINLTIYPRRIVALVGRSGCGKTTLAQILAGNLKPTTGRVVYDSVDGSFLSQTSLRRHVGIVMQSHELFQAGIGENIAYADDAPKDDRIKEVAYDAHLSQFVTVLPAGFSTVLGEGGTGLSGGQLQRLSIARTLYRDPKILIFDEATSALDAESEQAIIGNMRRFIQGRTSIIIAHRLSTIRHADIIYVMKDGVIVEEGTHDELLPAGGHYSELFAQQAVGLEA